MSQEYPELIDVLNSFDLPTAQLEFTFEELFKATNMRSAVSSKRRLLRALFSLAVSVRCFHLLSLCAVFTCCAALPSWPPTAEAQADRLDAGDVQALRGADELQAGRSCRGGCPPEGADAEAG